MASVIKLKRSLVSGDEPSSLQEGELAVNIADKKLYIGGSGGSTVERVSGDLYNFISQSNTEHNTTAADLVLTVDNLTLSNDIISLIGTDAEVDIVRNANGSITFGLPDDVTIAGQLSVSENIVTTGNGEFGGTLDVTNDFTINTNKFTVAASTGNMYTAGTLESDGEATLASATIEDLTDNRVVIAGTGGVVEDDANLTFNGSSLDVGQGNFTVAVGSGDITTLGGIDATGTLNVDGSTTLNGLSVTTLQANGAVNIDDTTGSTSTSTGALVVDGGAGIAENLYVGGGLNVSGSAHIDGNLTVEGGVTYISSQTVNVDDSMLKLAANNAGDAVDTGVYGLYVDGATSKYAGYFRDVNDSGIFKFYTGLETEPGTTVDTNATGYALAQVDAIIDGGSF